MSFTMQMLLWGGVKLGLVACGAFYALLVFTTYVSDGPYYDPRLDPAEPARSAQHLLVWLGVKAFSAVVHAGRSTLEALCEASADVGMWAISKSSPRVQARVRSRFF